MICLVLPLAAYGVSLGLQIRVARLAASAVAASVADFEGMENVAAAAAAKAAAATAVSSADAARARKLHPPLMVAAALFAAVFGTQGGIGALLLADHPLLDSGHAATSGYLVALLATQALLGNVMGQNSTARTAHAAVGAGAVGLLLVHAGLGLKLGFSF
ncbi:unnamed protein product [Phaeothamnion confervicola]